MEPVDVIIGERSGGYGAEPGLFGMRCDDRRRHTLVLGKTGLGKSTLLLNMLIQDVAAGGGVALIDPHGDMAEELLNRIPRHRTDDVVYFDPADVDRPLGWNVLRMSRDRHLAVSGLISAFKHLWGDSWGPRLEYILANALLALAEEGGSTLLGVLRLLSDESYRMRVARRVQDPVVRAFWLTEFAEYDRRFRTEAIAPIQNKLGRLLSSAPLRNILSQVRSSFDLRFMMDDNRIFIANLSKGRIGEDATNFLGSLLLAGFQHAALSRANIPEDARRDFFLVVDECHNFTSQATASMLSELRKYRCGMTLAGQYLEQMHPNVRAALLANVGTLVAFGVSAADAKELAVDLHPFPPERLTSLDRGEVCIRLTEGGTTRQPFVARTLPSVAISHGRGHAISARSRAKYGRSREAVEKRITRWFAGQEG